MRESERETMADLVNLQPILQGLRIAGAVIGVIAMAFGLIYVTRVFSVLFTALRYPEKNKALIDGWIAAVGGNELDIVISGTTCHGANVVAVAVLGGGATVLAWLALALVLAGAKTISWTLSDREAVKKLLEHAFGPTGKPVPKQPNGGEAQ